MGVVPMQKVQVLVHQPDTDVFLATLQRYGALELAEVTTDRVCDSEPSKATQSADTARRVQHVVTFLESYAPKLGLWRTLRSGATVDCSEADLQSHLDKKTELLLAVAQIEDLQSKLTTKLNLIQELKEQKTLLEKWSAVSHPLEALDTANTGIVLLETPDSTETNQTENISTLLKETGITYEAECLHTNYLLICVWKDQTSQLVEKLTATDYNLVPRPQGKNTAAVELDGVQRQLSVTQGEIDTLHIKAVQLAGKHLNDLRILSELLGWEQDRLSARDAGKSTAATSVFEGWLRQDKRSVVETALQTANVTAVITNIDTDEEPPVEIKNHRFFQPFEVVTRLYGLPGYKDLDPTLFLAGFFFIFFGLSLTDVGYGLTLVAVAALVLTCFRVSAGVRTFMKLFLFMGIGSALLGALFGGYLGIPSEALPNWLQAIQLFDPINNPLPVFYLALGLGVVQIMFGMLLKIYSQARNGRLVDGLVSQLPWLGLFIIGVTFVGVSTGLVHFVTLDILTKLLYIDIALIALAAARTGKGIVGKIVAVLASLYNDTIGYFSDILSYSRLLALGLATSALAFAVNLIAELVSGTPVVGPFLAVVILVIGHVFALVINTLGAFIHSARLQFVEFFGKFIDGSGRNFTPLKRSSRYITAREE